MDRIKSYSSCDVLNIPYAPPDFVVDSLYICGLPPDE